LFEKGDMTMLCECGGILFVKKVEKIPDNKNLNYDRLCDVECIKCGKIYYSQPYDFGKKINVVKKIED
jgi:hypothetical protein